MWPLPGAGPTGNRGGRGLSALKALFPGAAGFSKVGLGLCVCVCDMCVSMSSMYVVCVCGMCVFMGWMCGCVIYACGIVYHVMFGVCEWCVECVGGMCAAHVIYVWYVCGVCSVCDVWCGLCVCGVLCGMVCRVPCGVCVWCVECGVCVCVVCVWSVLMAWCAM